MGGVYDELIVGGGGEEREVWEFCEMVGYDERGRRNVSGRGCGKRGEFDF